METTEIHKVNQKWPPETVQIVDKMWVHFKERMFRK